MHGTGTAGPYVPNLEEIRDELVTSGDLSSLAVTGLQWVRHNSIDDASPAGGDGGHPVVVLSPGSQTNVVFYSAIAEELASHGHVVVGLDHPYQVAATVTGDGRVAGYDETWDSTLGQPMVPEKVAERVADIEFVLKTLASEGGAGGHRVVTPAATHDGFTDGALLTPGFNPLERQTGDVMEAIRGFLVGFLDIQLKGSEPRLLGSVGTETDVYVNVYPLGNNPPIPVAD